MMRNIISLSAKKNELGLSERFRQIQQLPQPVGEAEYIHRIIERARETARRTRRPVHWAEGLVFRQWRKPSFRLPNMPLYGVRLLPLASGLGAAAVGARTIWEIAHELHWVKLPQVVNMPPGWVACLNPPPACLPVGVTHYNYVRSLTGCAPAVTTCTPVIRDMSGVNPVPLPGPDGQRLMCYKQMSATTAIEVAQFYYPGGPVEAPLPVTIRNPVVPMGDPLPFGDPLLLPYRSPLTSPKPVPLPKAWTELGFVQGRSGVRVTPDGALASNPRFQIAKIALGVAFLPRASGVDVWAPVASASTPGGASYMRRFGATFVEKAPASDKKGQSGGNAIRAYHAATEGVDAVNAVFNALPKRVTWAARDAHQKGRPLRIDEKLFMIINHADELVAPAVVTNLVREHYIDKVIGRSAKQLQKISGGYGPKAMQFLQLQRSMDALGVSAPQITPMMRAF